MWSQEPHLRPPGPDGDVPVRVQPAGVVVAAVVLLAGGWGGMVGLGALIAGTLLLDVAMQCGMVANQARIFALRPDARIRLNTAYMTCAYLGGSAGSAFGVRAYGAVGWPGVCGLVAVLALLALFRHLLAHGRRVC
jgi:hypothetical protein